MSIEYNKGIDFKALLPVALAIRQYGSMELVPDSLIQKWNAIAYSEALGRPRMIPPGIFKWKPDHCTDSPDVDPDACDEHDVVYLIGGSRKDRERGDERLAQQTGRSKNKVGIWWAPIQWVGVRAFARFWGEARWAHGWRLGSQEPGVKY